MKDARAVSSHLAAAAAAEDPNATPGYLKRGKNKYMISSVPKQEGLTVSDDAFQRAQHVQRGHTAALW